MAHMGARKAVLIIARKIFRDEELFDTQKALEKAGVKTTVASSELGDRVGKLGGIAQAEMLVNDISADDFNAIVFIGGAGAAQYYDDDAALNLARDAAGKGKVVAAICIGPRILANAGLLGEKNVTCFESEAQALRDAGANFIDTTVVKDEKIVTGSGPAAAMEFGQIIAMAIDE